MKAIPAETAQQSRELEPLIPKPPAHAPGTGESEGSREQPSARLGISLLTGSALTTAATIVIAQVYTGGLGL